MHITDEHLTTYKKQGYLIFENFLSKAEQEAARDGSFSLFAPSYERWVANNQENDTASRAYLQPDAGAEVGHCDGGLCDFRRAI